MPMGPSLGGLAYFAGVKLAGYTGYAYVLRKRIFDDIPNGGFSRTFKIGATRTGIGVVTGAAYGGLALLTVGIFGEGTSSGVYYMLGLLPIRFLEWWMLLWLFFRPETGDRRKIASGIGLGIVVSYLLDAIGIEAAFVLPGGVWVC
jgi:hypothetical protein